MKIINLFSRLHYFEEHKDIKSMKKFDDILMALNCLSVAVEKRDWFEGQYVKFRIPRYLKWS